MRHRIKPALVVLLALAPVAGFATNGMFMIGYGAKSTAMGGTAIANPQDALAGASNPATISEVGMRADVGADLFLPKASAQVQLGQADQGSSQSSYDKYIIPAMAVAMPFKRNIFFGFSAVGAGGGGTRYSTNLFNLSNSATTDDHLSLGVSLMMMQMNPTVAFRVDRHNTFGASLVIGIQQFRAFGLDNFSKFTLDPSGIHAKGNDYGYGSGLRLGWLGKFLNDRFMVGLAGTTKVYMSRFDQYQTLFAQQGSFDTPANYGLGLSYKTTDKTTVALDITRTLYTGINSIGDPGPNASGTPFPVNQATNALGQNNGLGFGWKNQTVYKLGVAYAYDDHWTFRAGWNYGKSPIPAGNGAILFNILAPAVTQNHLTLGTGYKLDDNKEVNVYFMHAFRYSEYGPTNIAGPTSEIAMSQNALGATLGLKF